MTPSLVWTRARELLRPALPLFVKLAAGIALPALLATILHTHTAGVLERERLQVALAAVEAERDALVRGVALVNAHTLERGAIEAKRARRRQRIEAAPAGVCLDAPLPRDLRRALDDVGVHATR